MPHTPSPVCDGKQKEVTVSKHDSDHKDQAEIQAKPQEEELPPHWEKIHGAIWMIGLAYLFWRGPFFPGILVLVAISSLAQVAIMAYVKRNRATQALASERELHLPDRCPNCGSPLSPSTVRWQGKQTATCPYCGSGVKATVDAQPTVREAT